MADLAREAGGTRQRHVRDDHAAADADLARDVEHVRDPDGGTAAVLGERPEVTVVRDGDRHLDAQGLREPQPERDVDPAEVWRHGDEAIAAPHDARDGDAHADERAAHAAQHRRRQGDEVVDHALHGEMPPRMVDADDLDGCAAQAHEGSRHGVDQELDREDHGRLRLHLHDGGRPARRAESWGRPFDDQPGRGELAHQGPDRAAGQARRGHELGSGERSALVDTAQDRAQVGAPDRLAPLSDIHAAMLHGL